MSSPAPRSAAIVAIGTELLGPLRQDTNSLWLSARLEEAGIRVVRKSVVGDDPEALRDELDRAASAAPLLFTTGGLGPTADDVTVAAVAEWAGAPLRRNEAFLEAMRQRFERRGSPMPECNAKQADFIVGADVLANPRGTAPGFRARKGGVEPERRPFRPHVTLARLRDPWPAAAVAAFRAAVDGAALPPYRCGAGVLYASRLHPSGAVHTPVRTLEFAERVEVGA